MCAIGERASGHDQLNRGAQFLGRDPRAGPERQTHGTLEAENPRESWKEPQHHRALELWSDQNIGVF